MTIWKPDLTGRQGPKYRQISDAVGESVTAGHLSGGTRLPPQRDLAYALGVSLNTVSRAYADAIDRGFLKGEVGRGTYVRGSEPPTIIVPPATLMRPSTGTIDFSLNLPAPGPAAAALSRTLADLSSSSDLAACLDYQTAGDRTDHRAAAAAWLGRVGLEADPESIVLTVGAQHGILTALLATTRPGDVLLTEGLTYAPIVAMARQLGLKIVPLRNEGGALDPEALDAACDRVAAKVFYCLPTLHTPTTATLDAEQRSALAAVARERDLTVIEDDVFGFLPPRRPPPLAGFAPERTLYITSLSKSLAPGLRVGFLLAPPAQARAVRTAVRLSSWMPPPLMAEIASRWIEDGTADRLTALQREEAAARQTLARDLLPQPYLEANPHGLHAWLTLPQSWTPERFRMAAQERGVKLLVGGAFSIDPSHNPRAVRLCLSHEPARARVRDGLTVIAELLQAGSGTETVIL